MYLPATGNLRDPLVSPIFAENLKNLPPALIITDEDDPMRDEGEEYAGRLKQDAVVATVSSYPNMIHGFFLMAGYLDARKKCIDELANTLKMFSGANRKKASARSKWMNFFLRNQAHFRRARFSSVGQILIARNQLERRQFDGTNRHQAVE